MSALGVAVIYSLLIVLASLFGGWLPGLLQLNHSRMQTAISFVAGVVLGIGLLHLLPHGYFEFVAAEPNDAMDRSVWWLLMGFLATFFLQRMFHFHSHEVPDALTESEIVAADCAHSHGSAHAHSPVEHRHAHTEGQVPTNHRFTWGGILFGLAIHSLVDGIALAAAMEAEWEHGGGLWAGFAFFLAVVLHKPFDSLSITSLMLTSGWSPGWRNGVNFIYALAVPLGMVLFYLGLQQSGPAATALVAGTLCFAGGACLCISSSDLLPELQFHSHDRLKLSASLLLGLALAWGLVYVENQGHGHQTETPTHTGGNHEHHDH